MRVGNSSRGLTCVGNSSRVLTRVQGSSSAALAVVSDRLRKGQLSVYLFDNMDS